MDNLFHLKYFPILVKINNKHILIPEIANYIFLNWAILIFSKEF